MHTQAAWNNIMKSPAKAGIWPQANTPQTEHFSNDWLLRLATLLQTTLSMDQLIEVYHTECNGVLGFDSLGYRHETENFNFSYGTPGQHSCSYKLSLANEDLGEITYTRSRPFKKHETMRLEFLTSHLLYPARNAMLYHQALQAASRDPLTGVYNRAALEATLDKEVSYAQRYNSALSIAMLDLDRFKLINDQYGHIAGDCVLKSFIQQVQGNLRQSDTIFRYGGDEFTMVLPHTSLEGASLLGERILNAVRDNEVVCDGIALKVTASLGVVQLKEDETSQLLKQRADTALYQSKANNRDRVTALD